MKPKIHPKYEKTTIKCACGNEFETRTTLKGPINVEICSNCHPFFSGEMQRIVDIEGQVDRFYKKLQARQDYVAEKKARESEKVSPERPVAELELGKRPTEALAKVGIKKVGQLMNKFAEGEEALLAISGFGQKSLIDTKKKLRALGYEFPEAEKAA